jgi:hypothetical protein
MSLEHPNESVASHESGSEAYERLLQTLSEVDREFDSVANLKESAETEDDQRRYERWHSTLVPTDYGLNVPAYTQHPENNEVVGDATQLEIRLPWGMPDYSLPHSQESAGAIWSTRQVLTIDKVTGARPRIGIRTTVTYMSPDWGVPAKDDLQYQSHGRDISLPASEFHMQVLEVNDDCDPNQPGGKRERSWHAQLTDGRSFPSPDLGLSNPEMQAHKLTESSNNLASEVSGDALEEVNRIVQAGLTEWKKWQENPPPKPVKWG